MACLIKLENDCLSCYVLIHIGLTFLLENNVINVMFVKRFCNIQSLSMCMTDKKE
jgi:hypothetical protein